MLHFLPCAAGLATLCAADGDLAVVYGRLTPGDGQWTYRWAARDDAPPNGGTVLAGAGPGCWRLCHNGTVSLQCFGVFGPDTPADDALDALVNDAAVQCIQVTTDVNFTRRHTFFRSRLTIDFTGHKVTALGVAPAAHNDPFGGVLHFAGQVGDAVRFLLREPMPELYDIFEVPDTGRFPLYSWWQVAVNPLTGREEKEIDKLLQVTEILDGRHLRVNYKMGWPLAAGRQMTWQAVQPVERVDICHMEFWGNPGGEAPGAHPLVFTHAVRCNVWDVHAYHTYWPVLLRRHNTGYVTERCSLTNPTEVVVGGTGYLTQQIHCLYGAVRDCTAHNARHLNDFTGSAYCLVENCHGDGDFHGAFVTHGQFEHDLTYLGNSGLLSFANSGPTWGSAAKRITVERHVGCWGIGFAKISDLTLRDVTIVKTEKYDVCGKLELNADGLQVQGCTALALVLTQRSRRAHRPTVIRDCWFRDGVHIVRSGDGAVDPALCLTFEQVTTDRQEVFSPQIAPQTQPCDTTF